MSFTNASGLQTGFLSRFFYVGGFLRARKLSVFWKPIFNPSTNGAFPFYVNLSLRWILLCYYEALRLSKLLLLRVFTILVKKSTSLKNLSCDKKLTRWHLSVYIWSHSVVSKCCLNAIVDDKQIFHMIACFLCVFIGLDMRIISIKQKREKGKQK